MRLIDADKLIQELEVDRQKMLAKYYEEDCDSYYGGVLSSIKEVVKNIKNKPTAYDVDAVVKQLEELKKVEQDREDECDEDGFGDGQQIFSDGKGKGRFEAFYKAIEIVKGGGVDNE